MTMRRSELIRRIEALPAGRAFTLGDSALTEDERQLVSLAYMTILGKEVRQCSCRNRYSDALMEIIAHTKKERLKKMKYELKAGALIYVDGKHYSNANLTDEAAEKWRAMVDDDEFRRRFQRYPASAEATDTAEEPAKLKPTRKGKKQ